MTDADVANALAVLTQAVTELCDEQRRTLHVTRFGLWCEGEPGHWRCDYWGTVEAYNSLAMAAEMAPARLSFDDRQYVARQFPS